MLKIISLEFEKSQRSVTHDFLLYINILIIIIITIIIIIIIKAAGGNIDTKQSKWLQRRFIR